MTTKQAIEKLRQRVAQFFAQEISYYEEGEGWSSKTIIICIDGDNGDAGWEFDIEAEFDVERTEDGAGEPVYYCDNVECEVARAMRYGYDDQIEDVELDCEQSHFSFRP